jgi:N-acetylglucosamine kinase-like BadF-type ATPase
VQSKQSYLLGIDIGGTKIDYLLCKTNGSFVDFHRTISPGHKLTKSLKEVEAAVARQLKGFLSKNGINSKDITSTVVGTGRIYGGHDGYDINNAKNISFLGLKKVKLVTDGTIGFGIILLTSGLGVCVFAGTGTTTVGRGVDGGYVTSGSHPHLQDETAKGQYLRDKAVSALYAYHFRCGRYSSIFPEICSLLKVEPEQLGEFMMKYENVVAQSIGIIQCIDDGAMSGDPLAMEVLNEAGVSAAHSAAGCIKRMNMQGYGTVEKPIEIILVGSIWLRIIYDGMRNAFYNTVRSLVGQEIKLILLDVPPCTGAVMLAKQFESSAATVIPKQEFFYAIGIKEVEMEVAELKRKNLHDADLLRGLTVINKNRGAIAQALNIPVQIYEILAKYPILTGVSLQLATTFLPAICAVLRQDYEKALLRFLGASQYTQIPNTEIEPYIQLAINIAAAAEDEEQYVHFSKARISYLLESNRNNEAKQELNEFLAILPNDEGLLSLMRHLTP